MAPEEQVLNAVQETTHFITENATTQPHADCHSCSQGMFLTGSAFPSDPSGPSLTTALADWEKHPVDL